MKTTSKRLTAFTLGIIFMMTHISFAEELPEETAPAPAVNTPVAIVETSVIDSDKDDTKLEEMAISTSPEGEEVPSIAEEVIEGGRSSDLEKAEVVVQEAFNSQETVSGDMLESTANPESVTSTENQVEIIPLATSTDATTTEEVIAVEAEPVATTTSEEMVIEGAETLEVVVENVESVPESEPVVVPEVAEIIPKPQPIIVLEEELEPAPEYAFALTGKHIPTKKKVDDARQGATTTEEVVTAALTPVIDNATGVVMVSGQCSDAYFVILLFKNADDYDSDPRSYIVNRAYPCETGAFSYAISELPNTLDNGTYYLLVGSQGERGAWTPITGLTEITINRN